MFQPDGKPQKMKQKIHIFFFDSTSGHSGIFRILMQRREEAYIDYDVKRFAWKIRNLSMACPVSICFTEIEY